MYLIAIAWIYVVLMMAVAEALSTQGSVLGAVITFVLYGLLPLSILLYVMGSPMRRRARLQAEQAADKAAEQTAEPAAQEAAEPSADIADASAAAPDGSGQPAGGQAAGVLASERKEI
jgi:membrane protein implicated in regulation of membrane protease activity